MILEIFVIFLFVCFGFLFYGWYVRQDLYRLIGVTLLILLGASISPSIPSILGSIEYHNGDLIVETGTNTTVIPQYSTFANHSLGWFVTIVGLLGLVQIMVERRSEGRR